MKPTPHTPHTQRLSVNLAGAKVGEIAQAPGLGPHFSYDAGWLEAGFPLTPHLLEFRPGLQQPQQPHPREFWGLYGVFNDSLPDGWGLMLMDRELRRRHGWNHGDINGLDRLAYMGDRAMGALEYLPMLDPGTEEAQFDLSDLARAAELVTEGAQQEVLEALRIHGGSGGGARPKVTVARDVASGLCVSGFQPLRPGFAHWLVKFRHKSEPPDTGRAEMAYAHMARDAGLALPDVDLIEVEVNGTHEAFFAVRRFDREGDEKVHMLSASGLLHASHRTPSIDYETLLGATLTMTGSVEELRKRFAQMVFNIAAFNRDDHAKNFAFLFKNGRWVCSPSYDLSMSPNTHMGGEHMTAVNGSGHPTRRDVAAIADAFDIEGAQAIADQVVDAAANWRRYASLYDVGQGLADEIAERVDGMVRRLSATASGGRNTRR
ncbi:type II toxin-antitoxin system HipA family toxin [Variovorax sp. H27-G14]|uniref:type II toxin-antitoxin system HipA family toxin n=1 Tax=Variovorax sp. H27-G14 TaxID=3111914 RepID=UPI0038FD3D13